MSRRATRDTSVALVALLVLQAGALAAAEAPDAPPLDGPKTVALPPTVDGVTPVGGRCLLLRIDKLVKLAVYDVAADRIKGYIPLGPSDTLVAAGVEKVGQHAGVGKRVPAGGATAKKVQLGPESNPYNGSGRATGGAGGKEADEGDDVERQDRVSGGADSRSFPARFRRS